MKGSDTQPPRPSPRNSHFLSVNNKTLVGAGDLGGESEKLKLADNKYESQLNALRLEEMFKNVFNGATHQDMINLKAEKYTQDMVQDLNLKRFISSYRISVKSAMNVIKTKDSFQK